MKEDKYRLLLIGDFAYFLNGRYFINLALIIWGSLALSIQSLHYWKCYKIKSSSYLKPFDMISGLVSPKSIGLMNREDINHLLKKNRLMFGFSRILTIGFTFVAFCLSIILMIISPSFTIYFIEIFWSLLFIVFGYFCAIINLSQTTYFYIICLYLKLKLRNVNNSIRKSFEKKYKMTNHKMKNILISLDSIISEINTYNNDFWSKYLIIVLISVIIALDFALLEAIFGKMILFFKILLFYSSCAMFLLLIILINIASSVTFEANKSYNLLNKLFITNKKEVSIRMKIKV
jgi:hypothetical protein